MPTPVRLRTDSINAAEECRDRLNGHPSSEWGLENEGLVAITPPLQDGDCWAITWGAHEGKAEAIAGYAICCPKCHQLHYWTTANNCSSKRQLPTGGWTCDHQQARTSCWTWTVDETGKPIQAVASLYANSKYGGCGYHGHLKDGTLTDG